MIIFPFESDDCMRRFCVKCAGIERCLHLGRSHFYHCRWLELFVAWWSSSYITTSGDHHRTLEICDLANAPAHNMSSLPNFVYTVWLWCLVVFFVKSWLQVVCTSRSRCDTHAAASVTHISEVRIVCCCGWFQGKLRAHRKLKLAQRCER